MPQLSTEQAVRTFDEVLLGYTREQAIEEARRVQGLDLRSAQAACPFGIDIPGFVSGIAAGDFDGALETIRAVNPWPGIMGRHCQRMCEGGRHSGDGTHTPFISALERAAADHGDRTSLPFRAGLPSGKRVAVVGAGSAGCAVVHRLRELGHAVALYDQLPVAGGMMFSGYPNFRLPLALLRTEIDPEGWGAEAHYDTLLTQPLLRQLVSDYDAVVLTTGKFKELRMGIPGEDLDGVWDALHFLTQFKLGNNPRVGRRVVVCGAGYTAQDSSRTCVRLGREVRILYRRGKEDMPVAPQLADMFVARQAAEGAPYVFNTTPVRILGENGKVVGLECMRTQPGPLDDSGRPTAAPVEGSNFTLVCDTVIEATGETVDLSYLPAEVLVTGGHVRVDLDTWMTSLPKLFAAGEMTG
ncbi:MAG TPA: FAD-dependent oxidoreductase, partial [Chloroflexota bacterium]|nr:FAD-dependent oxidoreductase [Chloroflexota bacterium]